MIEAAQGSARERIFQLIRRVPHDDWLVIGWALAIKLLLLVLGEKALMIFDDKRLHGLRESLELWNRWDAQHILTVAQSGYSKGPHLVIYPLYPWLIRALTFFTRDYLTSALVIATLSLLGAVLLLRRMVLLDFSSDVAQRAVWFFLIFPTAYFVQIGYTEPLFLLLVFASILCARKERWWLAGILGALAAMTRANGILLFPVLAVEAAMQWRSGGRKWRWDWIWILIVPAGFLVYLAINRHVGGDAMAWMSIRRDHFRTAPAAPWQGIRQAFNDLGRMPNQAEMVGFQELFFVALTFFCAAVSWWKLRPVYAAWITLNWMAFACLSFIQSAPRYSLVCFPMFILFGLLGQSRFWLGVISAWSLLYLAVFASLFARGWWAF